MIVWLASFPRSGNTFLRIVLHRCAGYRTSVIYDIDGVAQRLGAGFVGLHDRKLSVEQMRASDDFHFIKTHRQRDQQVHPEDRMLCLVRDGRDALVSWAHLRRESSSRTFESELRELIVANAEIGTGGWGQNVLSWLGTPATRRRVLRFPDLVCQPLESIGAALLALDMPHRMSASGTVPDFMQLHAHDPGFFRRGIDGSWRDELPRDLHELFWSVPDNEAAMRLIAA